MYEVTIPGVWPSRLVEAVSPLLHHESQQDHLDEFLEKVGSSYEVSGTVLRHFLDETQVRLKEVRDLMPAIAQISVRSSFENYDKNPDLIITARIMVSFSPKRERSNSEQKGENFTASFIP